ncbi:hypothetical protein AKG37_03085 [Bacillus australimaris]|uniref:Uncharacterized protein n=1 Tax=Bacillus australimaris TaxID=1326968 RepID=A0ABR5MY58_9BACI|nr:hypothetical protein AKG37_03085 [Bacillus australimaris]
MIGFLQYKKADMSPYRPSVQTNLRIRCQVCAPVLTNIKFAPLLCSTFLDFKGFQFTLKRKQKAENKPFVMIKKPICLHIGFCLST